MEGCYDNENKLSKKQLINISRKAESILAEQEEIRKEVILELDGKEFESKFTSEEDRERISELKLKLLNEENWKRNRV